MEKTVNDISVEGCTREQKKGYLIPSRPIPLKSRVTKGFLIRFRLLAAENRAEFVQLALLRCFVIIPPLITPVRSRQTSIDTRLVKNLSNLE